MDSRELQVKTYRVKWSLDVWRHRGHIDVPAEDVAGMSEDDRTDYFQRLVDEEIAANGPFGVVDSVQEIAP